MSMFFLTVLNMSISASWALLAVLLLRVLLKKAPKWIAVLLWGIVAVRLICPISFESVVSLIPSAQTVSPQIMTEQTPGIHSGVPLINNIVNPVIGEVFSPGPADSANPLQIWIPILSTVWMAGIAVLLGYTVISYFRLRRKIGTAVLLRDSVYQSENVASPFVLGIIKPKIYLPFHISQQDMTHVIAHENAHIRRLDHLWKPLGFLILTLHWFNPLMWVGYILLCRDIELACDEKVVKDLDTAQKADYSQALLTCSVNRRVIAACPLAFGEAGVKKRVKSVLHYKKPAFWLMVVAFVAGLTLAVCFLTNPQTIKRQSENASVSCNVIGAECDDIVYEYMYGTLNADYPYICVNWTNNTDDVLCFGDEFVIRKDGKVYEPREAVEFNTILHMVNTGMSKSENYGLSAYELEKGATYRLEKTFYLQSNPGQKYTAFIMFSIDTRYSFIGKQYAGEQIVYENGSFSSVIYTDGNMPQFMISEQGMELLTTSENLLSSAWERIDALQQIQLEKANFDALFTDEIWKNGLSAKKVRRNTLHAFRALGADETWYYLLEQKNRDIYIAQSDGSTANFRWLFKMKEVDKTVVLPLEAPLPEIDRLREIYPQFFHVSTDGGLMVYVWQTSANTYRCHLANTLLEALSDNSFAYEVGASIAEMRAILTTYDIDKRNITVQAVVNPLSSYYYELNDAYQANVKALFWQDTPTFASTVSYANWSGAPEIYAGALNAQALSVNHARHLPIRQLDTLDELEQFKDTFGSILSMNGTWDEVPSFTEVTAAYDRTFFEDNSLLLVYVSANNSTHRFKVKSVEYSNEAFLVRIVETTNAQMVDCAMAGWFVTVAVSDDLLADCTEFDAVLEGDE